MTDFVKILLDGLYCTENQFGISMPYGKWIKVIFENEEYKTLRNFVHITFYREDDEKKMMGELHKKDCDLQTFLRTWIDNIKLSGFSFTAVCCKDVFILEPKKMTMEGAKELDDFRKELIGRGLIDERRELVVVLKECRCT